MARITTLQFATRAAQGATLRVHDPLKPEQYLLGADGNVATLTLLGLDAPDAKALQTAHAVENANRRRERYTDEGDAAPSLDVITLDDMTRTEDQQIALLVSLTVAWSGFEDDTGAPWPCTPANAEQLYRECIPIRAEAWAFVNDRAGFFGASATASAPLPSIASASTAASATPA